MPDYKAPLRDMQFVLHEVFKAEEFWQEFAALGDVNRELADAILEESAKINEGLIAPLSQSGDAEGVKWNDGVVTTPAGYPEAFKQLAEGGWGGLSGEEQGLFGGQIVAAHALEQGWRIKAVLNNDMISNIEGINGVIDNTTARVFSEGTRYVETAEEARVRRYTGGEVDSPSRNLARFVDRTADQYIPNLDVMMVYRLDRFGRGGHHRPFNEAGIPGVRIMETNEHYDRQHQDLRTEDGRVYGDTMEGVDAAHAAKLTALNIAVLAQIAGAPPFPSGVEIEGAVEPSTTLRWTAAEGAAAGNLAGYRVHWRLTDQPQWQWSRFVGRTAEYTLENVVIDNYYFGVSAVATDGSETPVVFPGAAGSFGD